MKYLLPIVFLILTFSCKPGKISKTDKNKIPQCVDLIFDLTDGTISGVKPNLKQSEIKEWFPCYTKLVPDGANTDCGGALYYGNHGFTYFTYLYEYVEVTKDFKGKVTHDLFSKNRSQIREILGKPSEIDFAKEHPEMDFFSTDFGCLRIKYENDLPVLIAAYVLGCEDIDWCR